MANVPQSDNATKSVRIPEETWISASHESVDRQESMSRLLAIAWEQFISLPEPDRIRIVASHKAMRSDSAV